MRGARAAGAIGLLALGSAGSPALAMGQQMVDDVACVSGALPAGHWAAEASRRMFGLGLIREIPPQRAVSACMVDDLLDEAVGAAPPDLLGLVGGWRRRFDAEFPGFESGATASSGPFWIQEATSRVGFGYRSGGAAPGLGEYPPDRTGALPLPDLERLQGLLAVGLGFGDRFAARAAPTLLGDDLDWDALEVAARAGKWEAALGRGNVGFGAGRRGTVVLSGDVPLDRIQVQTARPLVLPGILRPVGRASANFFVGRIRDDRHPDRPNIWGGSLTVIPHGRFSVSIHRAALFGEGGERPSLSQLFDMLIGRVKGVGFEDQVISMEIRYRLPTDSVLPLLVYVESGAEDAAGAWWDVPGTTMGAEVPAIPGVPALAVGAQYSRFAHSCCGNPKWYRHWSFPGAWALRDQPLAHPIGGEGTEAMLYVDLDLRPLQMHLNGFRRRRGEENLFVPGREGTSFGLEADASARLTGFSRLFVRGRLESAEDWSEKRVDVGAEFFLPN